MYATRSAPQAATAGVSDSALQNININHHHHRLFQTQGP